jgi:EAL domain-containing protein (putative c-di-GMP-specific phosphodiesterase class I)
MPMIDRWVINETFATVKRRYDLGSPYPETVAINLSGGSLGDESLLEFIKQQFGEHWIPPRIICFEITETAAISNLVNAIKFIKELKTMGCRFSLDDFGSGLSSFTYLKNMPVDYLKIDGSFVKDMLTDNINHAMVQSINQIGHVMGIKTIAEFVESTQLMEKLRALGVDYAQGYGIEKPRPFTAVVA